MTTTRTAPERIEPAVPGGSVHHLKSLEKGLALLEAFGQDTPAMTLTELARKCGFHISTVQRLTATLCQLGYLKKDQSKRYHLGLKVIKLGYQVTRTMALRTFLLPYLQGLFREIDETVNLFLLEGDEVVIVERLEKRRLLTYNLQTGSSLPLYCTAAGKAILSLMATRRLENFFKRVILKPFTPYTLTEPEKLTEALKNARERGYAVNYQELALGTSAVAVAFLDGSGSPRGAVSAAMPASRFDLEAMKKQYLNPLKETARVASSFLENNDT